MLSLLFADRKLGAASKLAFFMLWRFAGNSPGRIVITADWLAGQCGRSPRAAWDWLAELERHDVIKLGERNERRGSVVVDVYNPAPGSREAIPDAQASLPLAENGETGATDAQRGMTGVFAPKAPSPLIPKNQENNSYQSTNAIKDQRAKEPTSQREPGSMVEAFAAVMARVETATDPATQKDRLKRRIMSACHGKITEWVAGAAANLVVYHDTPFQEVNAILCDIQAMFDAGSLHNPGAFAHSKFRQLAARLGKPWPRKEAAGV